MADGRLWAAVGGRGRLWEAIAGKGGEVPGDSPGMPPWVKAREQFFSPRVEKCTLSEEEQRKRDREPQLQTQSLSDHG